MQLEQFSLSKKKAYKLWKEYVEASKQNPTDKFLQDMKKVYNQLKSGRKVIDINEVFQRSGINMKGEPRLAIALAKTKTVQCVYYKEGRVTFLNRETSWDYSVQNVDVSIREIFPAIPEGQLAKFEDKRVLKAPVPVIPASIRPKGSLDGYYVLWEVDEWKRVPPRDPYLLRRISNNMFVVVAGWKLTSLERAVMKGRVW